MANKCKLTAKQKAFVECYCSPVSDTFNNQRQSAVKAGYSRNTGIAACQNIIAKHSVQVYMVAYKAVINAKQAIKTEYIQREHERLAGIAEKNGDLPTATRNKELLGKTIGAYKEVGINLNADIPTEPEAYKSWLQRELEKVEGTKDVIESYDKSRPAIAERY